MLESKTEYKCEDVKPYDSNTGKKEQITKMFDAISTQYDLMNRAMTMGADIIWRKKAINSLKPFAPKLLLDVATGTGDFAIEAYNRLSLDKVIGVDISENMLQVGREKIEKLGHKDQIELQVGDSMNLSFESYKFDAVTVAFGVRNYESLEKGISEMYRVLKYGGNLIILEMSRPYKIVKPLYFVYTKFIISIIASLFSKDTKAYHYLPDSIDAFPEGKEMIALLRHCGFANVKYRRFTFGVCAFYLAQK